MNLRNMRYLIFLISEFLSASLSWENVKSCLFDQRGGLILPVDGIPIEDKDWIKYKSLKKDNGLESINPEVLPSDFCIEACKLVDEFRKKTVNEKVEWMLYFDYRTGEVVYCWEGDEGKCNFEINRKHIVGRNIASIHSHTRNYYSFPSPDNFDILENDFEDYEIITSVNAFWIVEFKGSVTKKLREKFQSDISIEFKKIEDEIKSRYVDVMVVRHMSEMFFSKYLLNDIEKSIENIPLLLYKKEYD